MSVLDPEIESAIADAIGGSAASVAHATASAPADDQATRLRAMLGARPDRGTPEPAPTPATRAASTRTHPIARAEGAPPLLTVASGKGGVGKTNLSVNLAIALASRGLRIILLDADLGTANADVVCGLMPAARLDHVLTALPTHDGAARGLRDIAVPAPGGFRLIPGSAGVARLADLTPLQQRTLIEALASLESDCDLIIADTGAGIGRAVISLAAASDRLLVVTTPEPTAVADAYALIKCVAMRDPGADAEPPRISTVINQCAEESDGPRTHARLAAVCDRFLGITPISAGCVAQDVRVPEAVRARQPLLLRSPGSVAARNIQSVAAALTQQMGLQARSSTNSTHPRAGIRGTLARVLRLAGV